DLDVAPGAFQFQLHVTVAVQVDADETTESDFRRGFGLAVDSINHQHAAGAEDTQIHLAVGPQVQHRAGPHRAELVLQRVEVGLAEILEAADADAAELVQLELDAEFATEVDVVAVLAIDQRTEDEQVGLAAAAADFRGRQQ